MYGVISIQNREDTKHCDLKQNQGSTNKDMAVLFD